MKIILLIISILYPINAYSYCVDNYYEITCDKGYSVKKGVNGDLEIDDSQRKFWRQLGIEDVMTGEYDYSNIGKPKKYPTYTSPEPITRPDLSSHSQYTSGPLTPEAIKANKQMKKTFGMISGASLVIIGLLLPTTTTKTVQKCEYTSTGKYPSCHYEDKTVSDDAMQTMKVFSILGGSALIAFSFTIEID